MHARLTIGLMACVGAIVLAFFIGLANQVASVFADDPQQATATAADKDLRTQIDELSARISALDATTSRLSLNDPPVGCVVAYLGPVPEDERARAEWERTTGWLTCDGRSIAGLPDYDQLRHVLGSSHLPDLRSRFLRGVDFRSEGKLAAVDPDGVRASGSQQGYATARPVSGNFVTGVEPGHSHAGLWHAPPDKINPQTGWTSHGNWVHAWRKDGPGPNDDQRYLNSPLGPLPALNGFRQMERVPESKSGEHSHQITAGGDLETRPVNVAVNWIIKATARELFAKNIESRK